MHLIMTTQTHKFIKIVAVVSFYWVISITTVFVNKIILSNGYIKLDAPFFVTWFQCFVSALYYFIYSIFTKATKKLTVFDSIILKHVFPLAFVFASMIVFNNLCLKLVDVSFYYIGRSLTTVFNVLLSYLILKYRTSMQVSYCCLIIILGFWLGVDQEHFVGTFSLSGTIYGILGSVSVAYYAIKVKEVLPRVNSTIWLLSFFNNVYSCIIFLPLILVSGEAGRLMNNPQMQDVYTWILLLISGICGLTIGYATTLQIKVTSPLTHNISGTAKACAQTIIASYFYNEKKPWMWWISNWIVLFGSAAYTRVKQKELERKSELTSISLLNVEKRELLK